MKTLRAILLFAGLLALLLGLVPGASATPSSKSGYVVVLKDSVSHPDAVAAEHGRKHGAEVKSVWSSALNGYSASMTPRQAKRVAADERVASIEPDGIATIATTQTNATWGLDRIDQRSRPLNGTFSYTSTGSGVTAYIIDTGIRFSHQDFGGRADSGIGYDAVDGSLPAEDCNGHGTHVAGTVGGSTYGVAKDVTLVAVRVLSCNGSGYWSWVIDGVNWVTGQVDPGSDGAADFPAVANMSLGGGAYSPLDTAIRNSIATGVSYALAAGNSNANACNSSPARVGEAMTIGASDRNDMRASWSNHGTCLDWFAPGVGITSAWYTSDTATGTISGTSMASPHTAGVAALYLQSNPAASPAIVRAALYNLTTKGIVRKSKSANSHLLYTNL